jgi:hypothetical protein
MKQRNEIFVDLGLVIGLKSPCKQAFSHSTELLRLSQVGLSLIDSYCHPGLAGRPDLMNERNETDQQGIPLYK